MNYELEFDGDDPFEIDLLGPDGFINCRRDSVAIDGETVVIGAYTRNYTSPAEAGVVFVGRIP